MYDTTSDTADDCYRNRETHTKNPDKEPDYLWYNQTLLYTAHVCVTGVFAFDLALL